MCAVLAGCRNGGTRFEPRGQGPRPDTAEILADLRANDAAVKTLRLSGRVSFSGSPVFKGEFFHLRPDKFYLVGRKVSSKVVWMAADGDESLLVLPRKKRYYHLDVEDVAGASFSPAAMLREVLFTEDWANVAARKVRLADYDAEAGTAHLELSAGADGALRRIVTVQGRPWVVIESRVCDAAGALLSETLKDDYVVVDGVRLPKHIVSSFPAGEVGVEVYLKKMSVNEEIDADRFDIGRHLKRIVDNGFDKGDLAREDLGGVLR